MKRPKKPNIHWCWLCKPPVMFGKREHFVDHTMRVHQGRLFEPKNLGEKPHD